MRAAALALLIACGAPAHIVEPPATSTPYCFALVAERDGVHHGALACADTPDLCDFARGRAVAFAGLAHFLEIGACRVHVR